MKDKDRSVQIAAAENLARLGDPAGIPALEKFASERPAKSKVPAAAAVEELRALARGKTRAEAIRALVRLGSVRSAKVYQRGKRDPVGTVRDAAAAGLARLGDIAELDPFGEALQSEDEGLRAAAARALGEAGVPETLVPLSLAGNDPSPQVRAAAMVALGTVGGLGAVAPLKAGLNDKSDLVRAKALESLGAVRYPGVVPALLRARESETNAYLQLLALESLARHGQEIELNLAQRSLSQPDVDTRLVGVRVLEAAPGNVATQLLGTALDDADGRVRVRAAAALVRRLGKRPPPDAAPAAAGALTAPNEVSAEDRVPEVAP